MTRRRPGHRPSRIGRSRGRRRGLGRAAGANRFSSRSRRRRLSRRHRAAHDGVRGCRSRYDGGAGLSFRCGAWRNRRRSRSRSGARSRRRGVPQRTPATRRRADRRRGAHCRDTGRRDCRRPGGRTPRRGGSRRRGRTRDGHAAYDIRGEVGCAGAARRSTRRPRSGLSGAIRGCAVTRPSVRRRTVRGRRGRGPFSLDEHRPDRRHLRRPPYPYDVAPEPADHVPGPGASGGTGPYDARQPAGRQHRSRIGNGSRRGVLTAAHRPPVLPPPRRLHPLADLAGTDRLRATQRTPYVG